MSTDFSECVFSWASDTLEVGLTDTCTIYEPPATPSRKASGAIDADYPTDWTGTTGIACKITPDRYRGQEMMGPKRVQAESYHILHLPAGTAITNKARVRVTASPNNADLVGVDFYVEELVLRSDELIREVRVKKFL
jgi:hypothetical protein